MFDQFLSNSICRNCEAKIERGEDRIVVMAVEFRGEEDEAPGRGDSSGSTYCLPCAAELNDLTVPSLWRLKAEILSHPSAGPRREDLLHRTVSLEGLASRRRGGSDDEAERESDEDALGDILSADREAAPPAPEAHDLRRRLYDFLRTPQAAKMPDSLKRVAILHARGFEQGDIAWFLKMSQPVVSRRLEQIFRQLKAA